MPRALLSVYDKTGIVEFAAGLRDLGWTLLSSGGTARALTDAGIDVVDVAELTGFPPILDHRVVTLHPRIHGGILADTSKGDHRDEMATHGIDAIDLVVVNLYPFSANPSVDLIDIGGPALVRAAAKNHDRVGVVVDQSDYAAVLDLLRHGDFDLLARRQLAQKAFRITSAYDAAVTSWLGADDARSRLDAVLPHQLTLVAERDEVLRYGENPHQSAARYRLPGVQSWWDSALQLNGKEMSYLNVLDTEAAWQLVCGFDAPAAVIVKHANPCAVAVGSSAAVAYRDALAADPVSAFGGIVAINREVDIDAAEQISQVFTEVVVAPGFTSEALDVLCKKESLRIFEAVAPLRDGVIDVRSIDGGLLVQTHDAVTESRGDFRVVSDRSPTTDEMNDLEFAWKVVAHTWSNAIVLAHGGVTTGIGGGQPNRVDAARLALARARESASGSVAASDAFFPFRDTVDELARAGVTAIIQPGGSVRDDESIAAANEHGVALVITGTRRFRH